MPKLGFVDSGIYAKYQSQGINIHVFFAGKDVTRRCIWANDATGEVELFVEEDGKIKLDESHQMVKELLKGTVVFRFEDDLMQME